MMAIAQNYKKLQESISDICAKCGRKPEDIRIVAVTKTHPAAVMQETIDCGIRDVGENKAQEIVSKVPEQRGNAEFHMIGHLQSNKVSKVVPLVDWIQSVDSVRILDKIEKKAEQTGKKIKVLVQVNTTGEEAKSGCSPDELDRICDAARKAPHIEFRGLMTIGPLNGSEKDCRKSFSSLREMGEKQRNMCRKFELSMGMSGDYSLAIEEGATMIRIGSLLFGSRNY